MPTGEEIRNILSRFSKVREALLRNDKEAADALVDEIATDPVYDDTLVNTLAQLSQMLLSCPIVYMKLLMTLVYLKSFKGKFSKKMQDQLLRSYGEGSTDNQNLQSSVPALSVQSGINVLDVANSWYNLLGKHYATQEEKFYDKTIGQFVRVANLVVGEGVGDRALIAAQNAVWASSAATLLTLMGCKNNMIKTADCAAIDQAVNDLLVQINVL